ncbi:MAG TPA: hypothetical protein VFS76_26045 [Pyrinomonadaceae bacterium]|nr:hypothetical protein [Pyrinomonadaceae bacterium]
MRNSLPAQRGVACAVLACVIGSLFTTLAQSQRPADQNQDRIVISKDEVLFDVVVRDKKGKLIKDLTLADFEVYEDGVKQFKDQTGRALGKLSSQYKLNGPIDKVEEAKKQRILFYREANLPPGRYDVETIAYDTPSGRASVRAGVVEVPASEDGKLRLSDVMLLKRAEPVAPADNNTSNPFRVGNLIVHPNLGEPIPRSLKQVPFFFTVYVPAGAASKPKLTIELVAQGSTLSKMPGELAEIDAMGRSQFVAGLPVEQIPAGNYELKITVSADGTSVSRSRSFTLVD